MQVWGYATGTWNGNDPGGVLTNKTGDTQWVKTLVSRAQKVFHSGILAFSWFSRHFKI
jgi:hypothetical protein